MLSRMVANYLMIGVLARLPAYSLHWGLSAGLTESLVVAAAQLVEVVQEGEAVGRHTGAHGEGEGMQW